jgi:hypothetical protein
MEPEGLLSSSQKPVTYAYLGPDKSNPRYPILFLEDYF